MWQRRAVHEFKTAYRNWFGTLTLRPDFHMQVLSRARERMRLQGIDYETLPPSEQFALRHFEISKEITKYLKRVRKASGAPFRFLLVAEAHKSGLPHYHVLLHEQHPGKPVRHRTLSSQWHCGFEKWRLVEDDRTAKYLCKYLAKDNRARVRASVSYGKNGLGPIAEGVETPTPQRK